jgi:hypothetical protein
MRQVPTASTRTREKQTSQNTGTALLTVPVAVAIAVDLIRFEKNLLQIGFFGAHDTRHSHQSTRRIEQVVNRQGQKIKVAAEFRASQELGLPSTADRDKYIAFMRLAMEQKAKLGALQNPVRFTGYRLLKELGLSYSGENYEDINRWGQRMADTTITSEQVIYVASRKKYANKTVHVFRSFTRAGRSNEDGSGRTESFEVVLEDWLLDNLNQSYVVPKDFNAYRLLKRPTGKGIFGYLHLWFHASQGRPVEKDYAELCMLLNIPVYRHISKIRETIGRSLDELGSIGYLRKWDVKPMITKQGYKLVLESGEQLERVLAITQRKQITEQSDDPAPLTTREEEAYNGVLERGISPAKASSLVRKYNPEGILDQIEYSEFLIRRDRQGKIQNPAGFIIYTIENEVPVPTEFVTSLKLKLQQEQQLQQTELYHRQFRLQQAYELFVTQQVDDALAAQLPREEFDKKLKSLIKHRRASDEKFAEMAAVHQAELAKRLINSLPPFGRSFLSVDRALSVQDIACLLPMGGST